MAKQTPVIEMTADGSFIERPKPTLGTIVTRLAVVCVGLALAALAFWTALVLLPFLLLAGVAGYFVLRHQLRKHGGSMMFRRY
jgi:fatty acid desaturase